MPRWIFSLFQFFPLSLFATYAFWDGLPTNERWIEAFQISAIAGLVQLVIVLPQRFPLNRLVLAGNIYLILGGLAALTGQWWYLQIYDYLRESAIFLAMLIVGIVATFTTRYGFIAAQGANLEWTRHYSILLLGSTAICFIPALAFEGSRIWSAVVPIIALAVLQRHFSHLASQKPHPTIG
jgi:hypothetical protein